MAWHYGDDSRMWHDDCGGEVFVIDDGYICSACKAQSDEDPDH